MTEQWRSKIAQKRRERRRKTRARRFWELFMDALPVTGVAVLWAILALIFGPVDNVIVEVVRYVMLGGMALVMLWARGRYRYRIGYEDGIDDGLDQLGWALDEQGFPLDVTVEVRPYG